MFKMLRDCLLLARFAFFTTGEELGNLLAFLFGLVVAWIVGRSENHKNELGICPEGYYYVLVYYKTGFEEFF